MEPIYGPLNFSTHPFPDLPDAPTGSLKLSFKKHQISALSDASKKAKASSAQTSSSKVPQVSHIVSSPKNTSQTITLAPKETDPSVLAKQLVEHNRICSFFNTSTKISNLEAKILFTKCLEGMDGEDAINFCNVINEFLDKNNLLGILKFLKPIRPDKKFAATMLIKKVFEWNANKNALEFLFLSTTFNNKNVENIIESAEKLFREKAPISEKIAIIKKFAGISEPESREILVTLAKKLLSHEETKEHTLKVINCLVKIEEDNRTAVVDLAYQFFDETIDLPSKLLVIEEIMKMKPTERQSICQFVSQIFPNNLGVILNEFIACIRCFNEAPVQMRASLCEKIKTYFASNKISPHSKVQFMEELQGGYLADKVLAI